MKKNKNLGFATKAIHIGSEPDKEMGSVIPNIYQTTTFIQNLTQEGSGYEYTRVSNPTRSRLESCLASLENADYSVVTASGISVTTLILQTLEKGSKVIASNDLYGGSYRLFEQVYSDRLEFDYCDFSDLKKASEMIEKIQPAMLWIESLTNPLLKLCDFKEIVRLAKESNVLVAVDNTILSPYLFNPLDYGADIVMHSVTKYINGHSDVIAGAAMTNNSEIYEKLFFLQKSMGPSQSPFDSWLTLRGVKTLAIRMEKSASNAMKIAAFLEAHPLVEEVLYPGLASHPQHELAKRDWKNFGAMISFYLKGDLQKSKEFLSRLNVFSVAISLGGIESLIELPSSMTHAAIPKEVKEKAGLQDNLIRVSVGIEEPEDLIADLEQSLASLSSLF